MDEGLSTSPKRVCKNKIFKNKYYQINTQH